MQRDARRMRESEPDARVPALQRLLSAVARGRAYADCHQAAVDRGGWLDHERLLFEVQRSSAGLARSGMSTTATALLELVIPTHCCRLRPEEPVVRRRRRAFSFAPQVCKATPDRLGTVRSLRLREQPCGTAQGMAAHGQDLEDAGAVRRP